MKLHNLLRTSSCVLALATSPAVAAGVHDYPAAGTVNPGDLIYLEQQSSPGVYVSVRAQLAQLAQAIGAGTAAGQNVGTSGAVLCLLNTNCVFSGNDKFTKQLRVLLNATSPSPTSNTSLQITGPDNIDDRIEFDSFNAANRLLGVRANQTASAPLPLLGGDWITNIEAAGYDGSDYSVAQAAMRLVANSAWSSSNHGTDIVFVVTAVGTTVPYSAMRLDSGGHLNFKSFPPGVTGCGSGATVVGSDNAFEVTTGTSPGAACTINFASPWVNTPFCAVQSEAAAYFLYVSAHTTNGITVHTNTGSITGNDSFSVVCRGSN